MNSFQETFAKFDRIDKQIYDRGNAAVRIGERMQSIERQREKADEAKMLIERFSQLNQQQQLPVIMTDDSKIRERASLIKKLMSITQELESIPNKTELGKKRVEECSNELENRLLLLFDQAQAEGNFKKMKVCATINTNGLIVGFTTNVGMRTYSVCFQWRVFCGSQVYITTTNILKLGNMEFRRKRPSTGENFRIIRSSKRNLPTGAKNNEKSVS